MPALTAVELNYFILRYLTESGFFHTAFMFECETSASKTPFDGNLIPPATLVELVQKGLQYTEKEEDLEKEENDEDKEFCSVQAMDLIEKVEYEEQKIESDEEKNQRMNRSAKSLRKGKLRKARERERLTERPWRKKQLTEMPWTKKKLAERPRRNEKLTELEDVLDIYR